MILAPAEEVSTERGAIALFLGQGPVRVIEQISELNAGRPDLRLRSEAAGSILIDTCTSDASTHARLQPLLDVSRASLRTDGRLAVLMGNKVRRLVDRLRSVEPFLSGSPSNAQVVGELTLSSAVRLVRNAGFECVQTFALSSDGIDAQTIRPLALKNRWLTPAYLITARLPGTKEAFLLERIVHAAVRSDADGSSHPRGRLISVTNSSRGKSVVLVEGNLRRVVIRIARSAAMLEDEKQSYELLDSLKTSPTVALTIPCPLSMGTVNGMSYFAQSHLPGVPLSTTIRSSNSSKFLEQVNRFLLALNPELSTRRRVALDSDTANSLIQPMTDFALRHATDKAVCERARALLTTSLRGAVCALGVVHGDLGTANILVRGAQLTGVIDWEAARLLGLPLLDAINYVDSAYRTCNPALTIADTLPLLASGSWPVTADVDFLRNFFNICGADFGELRGYCLLYALFHFGPQMRFASTDAGAVQRLDDLLRRIVE